MVVVKKDFNFYPKILYFNKNKNLKNSINQNGQFKVKLEEIGFCIWKNIIKSKLK